MVGHGRRFLEQHRSFVSAGTMFELTKELKDAAEALKKQATNPIGLSAGCDLFVAFTTLFPHDSAVSAAAPCIHTG